MRKLCFDETVRALWDGQGKKHQMHHDTNTVMNYRRVAIVKSSIYKPLFKPLEFCLIVLFPQCYVSKRFNQIHEFFLKKNT